MIDQMLNELMVPQVLIVAFCAGGTVQALKRAFKYTGESAVSKTLIAIAPVPMGAAMGAAAIPYGGVADPWAMGIVAGLISGSAYSAIAPTVKAWIANRSNTSAGGDA